MDINKATELIHKTEYKGIILGLERMRKLMEVLGNPQDELSFIHVTGTNGKGSVSTYIESILNCSGYKVGKYTSPAVVNIREQYCVGGSWITEEDYSTCAQIVANAAKEMESIGEESPTAFEMDTALAFVYFKRLACDYVVLETGLGGRLDATNIITRTKLAVFTSISEDHIGMIGNDLLEIADNKSGIIKPGCSAVMIDNSDSRVEDIIKKCADNNCAGLTVVRRSNIKSVDKKLYYKDYCGIDIGLKGSYQYDNCALAIEACEELNRLGLNITRESIIAGVNNTVWPFRMDCICNNPLIILDGAHNPDAALRLEESILQDYKGKNIILMLGIFKDKNYENIIAHIATHAKRIILLELPNKSRTLDINRLYACVEGYVSGDVTIECVDSVKDGCELAIKYANGYDNDNMILACGSLSYLNDAKNCFNSIIE